MPAVSCWPTISEMYTQPEAAALEQLNYHRIREMIRVTYTVGYNIRKPNRWDFALKLWSLLLIACTLASYYGHWQLFVQYLHDIPRFSESISTVFQSLMSIMKMLYFLVAPRKFYLLLRRACRHELLLNCELFALVSDLPLAKPLQQRVAAIMEESWISTRRQLMFYLFSCIGILVNYFVNSLVVNIYHVLNGPNDSFEVTLPLPALYPNWMDKGMSFPYYHIPLLLESCNLYICGMGAVSFDVLFIVLCLHGVGLMQSLSHMIECAGSPLLPPERRVKYLRCCIYQYQRVATFAMELNDCFRQIIIIQFMLSLFCWGLVLFQISIGIVRDTCYNVLCITLTLHTLCLEPKRAVYFTAKRFLWAGQRASSITTALRMLMYLAAGGYQIVIYCYNGQRFTTASERIPMAFYECSWYEECREFRRLIGMMIMRTNRSVSLDISWFTKMSLPTLMAMIRASGQYYVLLRNIMQQR